MIPAVIVHGGAGTIGADRHDAIRAGCLAAARAGLAVLAGGGVALDAAQAAVRVLEDCDQLNAGLGAVLTRDGTVELDASIMDGATLRIGAVAAVPDLRQPIDLARAVLDDGHNVLLAGPAAWAFARERGITPAPAGSMITERTRARYADELARRAAAESEGGTVGAVAIDAHGRLAAATSTGGIHFKRPGRVGDSPLPGCGTWADAHGAASATGDGEAIIRVTLTRMLVDRIARGATAAQSCKDAIDELAARAGGSGGVIAIDAHGRLAAWYGTPTMPIATAILDGDTRRAAAWISPAALADLDAAARAADRY
jgi:beta-aspartyl-peptidase (threonine type)